MNDQIKLSKGISGIAGEYLVAGELSLRGFMASITLRNNDSIDIHASNPISNKIYGIQVKSTQGGKRSWTLGAKAENIHSNNMFYVFALFKGLLERPEYFVVPSKVVADTVRESHAKWLATPGKKGQAHNDTNMRKFHDNEGKFLERWDLLV